MQWQEISVFILMLLDVWISNGTKFELCGFCSSVTKKVSVRILISVSDDLDVKWGNFFFKFSLLII